LWQRAIEDLHVNSLWQRLRQNLLLFLQLLFIALLAFAFLRPGFHATKLQDERLIFLIDTSASMSATDVTDSRLDEAKRQCSALIDRMSSDATAMIISFSDIARVEQTFSDNPYVLKEALAKIKPTLHRSSLEDALRAAAGLANPGRSSDTENKADVQVAAALPATMFILTDGGFRNLPDVPLGNLTANYMPIGSDTPKNIAITTFSTGRNPEKPQAMQAFARLENFQDTEVQVNASLYLNGTLLDAQQVTLPPVSEKEQGAAGVEFELEEASDGLLKIEVEYTDNFLADNSAYAVLNVVRPARVLVISPSVPTALRLALSTDEALKVSQVTYESVKYMESKPYTDAASAGLFDVIIYDRCVPPEPPQANTLFIGQVPNFPGWPTAEAQGSPAIIDVDRVHPLTQLVDMSNVLIAETFVVKPPKGGLSLIEADVGPVLSIGPRQSFEDAALGFKITAPDADGSERPQTDWPRRRSFPVFFMNVVKYLGGVTQNTHTNTIRPGDMVPIRTLVPVDRVQVKTPSGTELEVLRESPSAIAFTQSEELGAYEVREGTGKQASQQFAVNLFDSRESDLHVREKLEIGYEEIVGQAKTSQAVVRQEFWKWLLLLGLGIVLLEWYIYNQRVYV
jgi:von Willebrand factor type A domain/Aerotolerance regulator N-terminal